MGRRRSNDDGQIFAVVVMGLVLTGAAGTAQRFVEQWWPLLALGALGVAAVLVWLFRRRRARVRAAVARQSLLDTQVSTTDAMTGGEFENLIARLLTRDGFTDVRVLGGSGDLGADVTAADREGRRLVVQCKRDAPHRGVSSPDVQKFLGTVWDEHHADVAWYVTTSGFSKPARELAARRGVTMVGRQQLAEWMVGSAASTVPDGVSATAIPSNRAPRVAARPGRPVLRRALAFVPFLAAAAFVFDVAGTRSMATELMTDYVVGSTEDLVTGP